MSKPTPICPECRAECLTGEHKLKIGTLRTVYCPKCELVAGEGSELYSQAFQLGEKPKYKGSQASHQDAYENGNTLRDRLTVHIVLKINQKGEKK